MMLDAMLHDMLGAIAEMEKNDTLHNHNNTETGHVDVNGVKDITNEVIEKQK